jgi:lipid A 3-O-deacylase
MLSLFLKRGSSMNKAHGGAKTRCAMAFSVFVTLCASAAPARGEDRTERGTFSILFENDVFFNSDHDYTNGVELTYTTAPQDTPDWAVRVARWLPFFTANGDVRTRYAIGQSIFTPNDISTPNPPPTARPYAGFLYGAFGLAGDSGTHLDQLQVTLGVVGPDSLAERSQTWIHSVIRDRKPLGWDTQLHNEPAIVIQYERSMRLIPPQSVLGLIFDAEPHYGLAVGNVYDYVNLGGMARLGFNLPKDYGPQRIAPSLPGSNFFEPNGALSAYVFAGVDGRAIARNLFLDGNTFESSRSVDKLSLVGDFEFGAAITFDRLRIAFTHVTRSREYKTQTKADQFGAVDVSFRF